MPKIQLDIDKNIYPTKNPEFEYQANCKTLSAYFNKVKTGELGVWVYANQDSQDWWHVKTSDDFLFFGVPPNPNDIKVDGRYIRYDYGDIEIRFFIGIDLVNKSIVIKNSNGLAVLSNFLTYPISFPNLNPDIKTDKEFCFTRGGNEKLRILARQKAVDSAQIPFLPPCMNAFKATGKLCPFAKEHKCNGCRKIDCICDEGREIQYQPARMDIERFGFNVQTSGLTILVDWDWLNDATRVFPVTIHADITPGTGGGSVTGSGKFDDGVSGNGFTMDSCIDANANTFVGGTCTVGDTAQIAANYGTDYIEIDLGGTYTITDMVVEFKTTRKCDNIATKWEYYDGSWNDFVNGSANVQAPDWNPLQQTYNPTDASGTKVRFNINKDGSAGQRCSIWDITINGTAGGAGAPTGGLYGSLVGPFGGPMGPMGGRL